MFSEHGKSFIITLTIFVTLNGSVTSEFLETTWVDDVDVSNLSVSSPLLTTQTLSAVNCVIICTGETTTAAAIFKSATSRCICYSTFNGITSLPGTLPWLYIPVGYNGSLRLKFYVKFYEEYKKTKEEAESVCALEGARLVVVDTMERFNFIVTLSDYNSAYTYHVAANDEAQEDTFVWSNGTPMSRDAQLWHQYQPNNAGGNQNCVSLSNSKYDDIYCTDIFRFICELV